MIEIRNLTKTAVDVKLLRKVAQDLFRKAGVKRPISVVFVGPNPPKARRAFRRARQTAKLLAGQRLLDISVALVSPQRARQLNMIYRKKTYVPNVLSFDYGEIVLCPSKIRKDAKKYGILFKEELARVFVHGVLHLIGYDHIHQKDYQKMSRKETVYLSRFV
ncbi:MAG: putative rRNA maturation factor [Parcubacteria group bacterium Greene0714_21]|nr:MAG: putative rRNA maturation factor [Parcubacteria group bacterium Greene0416_39]TSC98035.1 MAG: putative rRNA maturation factor [Parcubacteria group bacterium Greene1014_47]TSD04174.1 MAG: putative rRNA maturation factor [Parcubacteria group bacterium Greene0714_21]